MLAWPLLPLPWTASFCLRPLHVVPSLPTAEGRNSVSGRELMWGHPDIFFLYSHIFLIMFEGAPRTKQWYRDGTLGATEKFKLWTPPLKCVCPNLRDRTHSRHYGVMRGVRKAVRIQAKERVAPAAWLWASFEGIDMQDGFSVIMSANILIVRVGGPQSRPEHRDGRSQGVHVGWVVWFSLPEWRRRVEIKSGIIVLIQLYYYMANDQNSH